jgi:hypothetical protein
MGHDKIVDFCYFSKKIGPKTQRSFHIVSGFIFQKINPLNGKLRPFARCRRNLYRK